MLKPIQNLGPGSEAGTETSGTKLPAVVFPIVGEVLQRNGDRRSGGRDGEYMRTVDMWIQRHNEALGVIEEQGRITETTFQSMKSDLHSLLSQQLPPIPPSSPCPDPHAYALQLLSFPPSPLFIKRRFTICLRLINRNQDSVQWSTPLTYKVKVYRMPPDSREVTHSRAGNGHSRASHHERTGHKDVQAWRSNRVQRLGVRRHIKSVPHGSRECVRRVHKQRRHQASVRRRSACQSPEKAP